ncbi:MAG: family 10 glycosylhydrolase [Candidatus Omnitrophota bacterium]
MKKKWYAAFCAIILLIPLVTARAEGTQRGLFVSLIQDPPVLTSAAAITKMIDFAKKADIGTLYVQVYRANEAWFPSHIADQAQYEACLKKLGADPMKSLIERAHQRGVAVYAWLNVLSLSQNKDALLLKKYGPGILTRNVRKKKTLDDYKIDSQFFLEPGDLRVRKEMVELTEELLRAYPGLDGILFDYIRYPDTKPAYGHTAANVARFKAATGRMAVDEESRAWEEWKRSQVTECLQALVARARKIRPGLSVSATGCMPYARAYLEAFQDWPSWLERGIVDSVTIMTYSPDPAELERWIRAIRSKVADFKKINICLGAYKLVRSPAAFSRLFRAGELAGGGSCVFFHYGSFLEDPSLSSVLTGRGK